MSKRKPLYLYLLSQTQNAGYDTYDACVVCAETEDDARQIPPSPYCKWDDSFSTWARSPDKVQVKLLGKAADGIEAGVVLASFNAG